MPYDENDVIGTNEILDDTGYDDDGFETSECGCDNGNIDDDFDTSPNPGDKRRPHFQDVKRPGGPRHRGQPGFHYNNQKQIPPGMNVQRNPNYPHINNNQPYVPPHEFGRSRYPISGHMQENAFMLIDTNPYIWDNTGFQYGQRISVAESVYTRVLQRKDPSCINLTGVFDMTQSMDNNITLNYYLEQIIKNQFHQLQGLIPVIKSKIVYKIYYTITDLSGGVVYTGSLTVTNREHRFHSTNVKDYYLLSDNNVAITHIPQIDFQGPYILTLEKITAEIHVIDIQQHVQDFLNPFYQWTKNNQKIYLANDVISRCKSDFVFTIAEAQIKFSTRFSGNLTTKLKVSFTSFLSGVIATYDTFNVWKQMFDTDGAIIRTMTNDIRNLKKDTRVLDEDLMNLEDRVDISENDIEDLRDDQNATANALKKETCERRKADADLSKKIDNEKIERINEIARIDKDVESINVRVGTIEEELNPCECDLDEHGTKWEPI